LALPLPCVGDGLGEATAVRVVDVDPVRVEVEVEDVFDVEPELEVPDDVDVDPYEPEYVVPPPASAPAWATVTLRSRFAWCRARVADVDEAIGTTTDAAAARAAAGEPLTSGMPSRLIPTLMTAASSSDDAIATSADADSSPPRERTCPSLHSVPGGAAPEMAGRLTRHKRLVSKLSERSGLK